jgi:hypothetical protein
MNTPLFTVAAALGFALVLAPVCASAYPTKIVTRSFAEKRPTDDLVVIDYVTEGNSGHRVSTTIGDRPVEFHITPNGQGSIMFSLKNPVTPGLEGRDVVINSLDRMFPAGWPSQKTKWRLAFTADFIWLEASTGNGENFDNTPVYSTVAFFGVPNQIYQNYINTPPSNNRTSYGNLSELMEEVKEKYAKWIGYPYDSPPGPFLYREKMRSAIFRPALVPN